MNCLKRIFFNLERSPQKILDELINELETINERDGFINYAPPHDEGKHSSRAIEIGNQLYKMDGNTLRLMKEAYQHFENKYMHDAASNLSYIWNEIGKKEWQSGRGECWLH